MNLVLVALTLVVALPLVGALAAVAVPRQGGHIAIVAAFGTLAAALVLATHVSDHGPFELAVGQWTPPLGIVLRADGPAVLLLAVAALILSCVVGFSGPWVARRGGRMTHTFWPLLLLLWGALNVIFVSRDLFNLYVGLELVSLTAVALVAIEGRRETLTAALRYLLFALTGSLLYLLGVVLIYAAHGTLDIGLLAGRLGSGATDGLALAAMSAGLAA
ncbi:MAG: proton-conducting transporter membrane subunit, partial [Wenzhouxiangella sp.]|nr:proton-conducting transporter membrane subunit [Wenzhouxiangella sp.]